MAKQNGNGKMTLTRRDFLKVSAAAGAAGGMLNLASGLDKAGAVPQPTVTLSKSVLTTCACCSVGCGLKVDVDMSNNIVDVYGDPNHVTNRGALCPKGGATVQWVNGDRRLGTSTNVHGITGPRYRDGDGNWTAYAGATVEDQWNNAIADAASRLVSARGAVSAPGYNSTSIAFLGCSHATNEENWVYRKLIANIGSLNTEHQARI